MNLSPERVAAGHTLAAQLGEIPGRVARYPLADLRTARRIVYDVRANWKVIVENYNECYHCSGVHPELCRIVPAFKEKGGSNLDWDNGVPAGRGHVHVHDDRHDRTARRSRASTTTSRSATRASSPTRT